MPPDRDRTPRASKPREGTPPPFEDSPELYDALFDWGSRLAVEEDLYRRAFARAGARRVLDAACGSGRHAMLFRSWGLDVEGSDLSAPMVEFCRARYGSTDSLRWTARSFCDRVDSPASFDAAVCTGNSLALAADHAAVRRAVVALLGAVRPGGIVLVHLLNLWRLPDGPTRWQKCVRLEVGGVDRVVLKGIRRAGDRGYVELAHLELGAAGEVEARFHNPCFLGLEADELRSAAGNLASDIEILGSFRSDPYVRDESPDLIALMTRRST